MVASLIPLNDVIKNAKERSQSLHSVEYSHVRDLKISYQEPSSFVPDGGFVANIDGKQMKLSDTAFKSACKMIKSKPDFFKQFSDDNAFPKTLINVMDRPNNAKGVLIRHNGKDTIEAFLPKKYRIRDAYEILEDFGTFIQEKIGEIKGVNVDVDDGNVWLYRIIGGENILPQLDAEKGLFPAIDLVTSDIGACPTQSSLGLYRIICSNGAFRLDWKSIRANWSHLCEATDFYDKSAATIRQTAYLCSSWSNIFNNALKISLNIPAHDLIEDLRFGKIINNVHADAVQSRIMQQEPETHWDLFNTMTNASQDLTSISERKRAESNSMKVFTEDGGLMRVIKGIRSEMQSVSDN